MTALQTLEAFEKAGGCLMLDGEELRYSCPPEAQPILEHIRENRDAIFGILNAHAQYNVQEWIVDNCVRATGTWTNVKSLWREYSYSTTGRAYPLTFENFGTVLEDLEYPIERGMIEGVCLSEDFLRAVELTEHRTM